MNKKENSTVLDLAQLIICADLLLHKYSKLSVEKKVKLIRAIEKVKRKGCNKNMGLVLCARCSNLHGKFLSSFRVSGIPVCGKHLALEVKEQLKVVKQVVVK
jgi:hypothetical protein